MTSRRFRSLFGSDPAFLAEAPGRVNLMGEHTDYNGGFVLPSAIPQRTRVELRPRADSTVQVASAGIAGKPLRYVLGSEQPVHAWTDYVQGTTALLSRDNQRIGGFDAWIHSNVPVGSGLSSSAALLIALLRAVRAAFDLRLDDIQAALLAQRVENEFVGARVGVMDPLAASLADERSALFLDTRSLQHERVPLPPQAALVVLSSGISHRHSAGNYNTRRAECEAACRLLGVGQLRDLAPADLPRISTLPAPLAQRARHVVTEDARVLETVAAFRAGDVVRAGELFNASHASQRDDYAASIPEIDCLVDLALADPEVYGARLTGGGFGGSVVLLTHEGKDRAVARRLHTAYLQRTGQAAAILVPANG